MCIILCKIAGADPGFSFSGGGGGGGLQKIMCPRAHHEWHRTRAKPEDSFTRAPLRPRRGPGPA